MASNAPLEVRIQTALEALFSGHRLPPFTGEKIDSIEEGKIQLQDYTFIQGFALIIASYDIKKQLRLESQLGHDVKNTVKKRIDREAAATRKEAKTMKPRKEDVSQLIDKFSQLSSFA